MENKVICRRPFTLIHNLPGENYSPCCWGQNFNYSPSEVLPFDHFTGSEMNRLRKDMLSGEQTEFLKSYCGVCWRSEENYGHSPRLDATLDKLTLLKFNEDGSLKNTENSHRFVEIFLNIFGNHCNLQCYECKPSYSSSRIAVMEKLDPKWSGPGLGFSNYNNVFELNKIDPDQFNNIISQLVNISDNIRTISIVGGEPMLMKSHFKLLDRLIDIGQSKNIILSYVSNMTVMKLENMKKYFDSFKHTEIQWSVDAIGERNTWLRYPTDWEETLSNVMEIKKYFFKSHKGRISATITPTILSVSTFKETYDWLFLNDLIFFDNNHANTVRNPQYLKPRHLPKELKEKISYGILKISKYRYNELMENADEKMFKLAVEYCDAIDKQRGTNWRSIFPEVAKYAN